MDYKMYNKRKQNNQTQKLPKNPKTKYKKIDHKKTFKNPHQVQTST